jgi:hypothetical protein
LWRRCRPNEVAQGVLPPGLFDAGQLGLKQLFYNFLPLDPVMQGQNWLGLFEQFLGVS